jgi:uncharacterized membrane protein
MNAIAIALHATAAVVWIGGMFFAYVVLRPAMANYEPARRLTVWAGVFERFFPWVWMTVAVLLLTGYWLLFRAFGGIGGSPLYVHFMQFVGLLMCGVFAYLYYWPYPLFKREVAREDWPAAGAALNRIRHIVLINLVLGLALVVVVTSGRYS